MKSLNQVHKILIAVEDSQYSDRVVGYGYDLAEKLNAVVALVHVNDIPVSTPYVTDPMLNEPPMIMPEVTEIQDDLGKKLLDRMAEQYGRSITTYTFHKIGNPKQEILETAADWGADLIILGTHGRTGLDHFISGSVAEKVARKSKCPVLIIPNQDPAEAE